MNEFDYKIVWIYEDEILDKFDYTAVAETEDEAMDEVREWAESQYDCDEIDITLVDVH